MWKVYAVDILKEAIESGLSQPQKKWSCGIFNFLKAPWFECIAYRCGDFDLIVIQTPRNNRFWWYTPVIGDLPVWPITALVVRQCNTSSCASTVSAKHYEVILFILRYTSHPTTICLKHCAGLNQEVVLEGGTLSPGAGHARTSQRLLHKIPHEGPSCAGHEGVTCGVSLEN